MFPGFESNQDPNNSNNNPNSFSHLQGPVDNSQQSQNRMNPSQNRNYSDNSPEKNFFAFQNEDQEQADADMPSYIRALFDNDNASSNNRGYPNAQQNQRQIIDADSNGQNFFNLLNQPQGNNQRLPSLTNNLNQGENNFMYGGQGSNNVIGGSQQQLSMGQLDPHMGNGNPQNNYGGGQQGSSYMNMNPGYNNGSGNNYSNQIRGIDQKANVNGGKGAEGTGNQKQKQKGKNNQNNKNNQVSLNDDLVYIDRLESVAHNLGGNYNNVCPFSNRLIDLRKVNQQNISCLFSNATKKYYLTYSEAYGMAQITPGSPKIFSLIDVPEAKVSPVNQLQPLDTSSYGRADRRTYFVSIEGYHSISSLLLFKIEKLCNSIEHTNYKNQLIHLNLSNGGQHLFDPNAYAIPYSEFRAVVSVYSTHTSEEPFIFEFLVDLSSMKMTKENPQSFAEVYYLEANNNIILGVQGIYDQNDEIIQRLNYKMNLDGGNGGSSNTGSPNSPKVEFGVNTFAIFKNLTMSLPLKRVDRKPRESASITSLDEYNTNTNTNTTTTTNNLSKNTNNRLANIVTQKRNSAKLSLNPNAPHFSGLNFGHPHSVGGSNPGSSYLDNAPSNPGSINQINGPGSGIFGMGPANISNPQNSNKGATKAAPFSLPSSQNDNQLQSGYTSNNSPQEKIVGPNRQTYDEDEDENNKAIINALEMNDDDDFIGSKEADKQGNGNKSRKDSSSNNHNVNDHPNLLVPPPGISTKKLSNSPGSNSKNLRGDEDSQQLLDKRTNSFEDREKEEKKKPSHLGGFSEMLNKIDRKGSSDRSNTPDSMNLSDFDPNEKPQKQKRPSLFVAALTRGESSSGQNSPGLINRIVKKYCGSGVSTPQSYMSDGEYASTPREQEKEKLSFFAVSGEDTPNTMSEEVMESFKLEDHLGNLVEYAKTYNGSRILQKYFPRANQQEIEQIINEIESHIDELMLDPYANYMFQTLAQSCSAEQRFTLLEQIAPSMIKIAQDKKGTHSLQAIISLINRDCEDKLIEKTLDGKVLELSYDPQGTHLIQKLISSIKIENIGFIYNPIIQNFVDIANNSYGLCVLKQLMSKLDKVDDKREEIIGLLYDQLENLIQNPFGNYAIQHAIAIYENKCEKIHNKILACIIQYSNQKFSSNVIEKCIIQSDLPQRKKYCAELAKPDRLIELMKNKYGNFVILKTMNVADSEDKQAIMQSIAKCVGSINVKKYKQRWQEFIEENPFKIPNIQTTKPSLFKSNSGKDLIVQNQATTSTAGNFDSPKEPSLFSRQFDEQLSAQSNNSGEYGSNIASQGSGSTFNFDLVGRDNNQMSIKNHSNSSSDSRNVGLNESNSGFSNNFSSTHQSSFSQQNQQQQQYQNQAINFQNNQQQQQQKSQFNQQYNQSQFNNQQYQTQQPQNYYTYQKNQQQQQQYNFVQQSPNKYQQQQQQSPQGNRYHQDNISQGSGNNYSNFYQQDNNSSYQNSQGMGGGGFQQQNQGGGYDKYFNIGGGNNQGNQNFNFQQQQGGGFGNNQQGMMNNGGGNQNKKYKNNNNNNNQKFFMEKGGYSMNNTNNRGSGNYNNGGGNGNYYY